MANPFLFRATSSEVMRRRQRVRQILLESLERRELLAVDVLGASDYSDPSGVIRAGASVSNLTLSTASTQWTGSNSSNWAGDDFLGQVDLNQSAWFGLVEESYQRWSQENGITFEYSTDDSAAFGLLAEGEDDGPRLLSVAPNSGVIFSFNEVNTLQVSPTELVLRFDDFIDTSNLAGIRLRAAGKDGAFGDVMDSTIVPGWIGAGDNTRIIVMRFAEPLPDDLYRVELLTTGANAVRNTAGVSIASRPADSTPSDSTIVSVDFRLQLGAKILGIVPQPIDRQDNGQLEQKRDVIRVYFNDDDLNPSSATNPAYYQLIFTADTLQPGDDQVFAPTSITYNTITDVVELKFAQPIDELVSGGGTFRLRIGGRDAVNSSTNPPVVSVVNESSAVGSTTSTAFSLGTFNGSTAVAIDGSIITTSPNVLPLDFPGSILEPGHRDILDESHLGINAVDVNPQITTRYYNFALTGPYGEGPNGEPLYTSITPEQIQRAREIFDIYSKLLGIDFVETVDRGLAVVVGPIDGPGGVAGLGGGDRALMDGAEQWDNSFGAGFFGVALHEIGHALGLGHTYDLPAGTVMGDEPELSGPQSFDFPGENDIVHGLRLYRRDNRDVDMYSFVVPAGQTGALQLEVLAERLANSSNLDSHLTLLKSTSSGIEVVATNGDSFGADSATSVDIPAESFDVTYYVAITAEGNQDFDPEQDNTGSGGFSQGEYRLRVTFESNVASGSGSFSIVDQSGTILDGDGDGEAGGNFDFWFRALPPSSGGAPATPRTIYVDKAYEGATSNGTLAQPMTNLNFTSWPANLRPKAGDVVRVAGDFGNTPLDEIPAYEFGRGGVGNQVLADGLSLQVPRGVTLMIDAGAIFKLQGSQVATGSQSVSVDLSDSALQVLGTTQTPVYFTSYADESKGIDTNPLATSPAAGDWGGIHIRNEMDRSQGRFGWERHGIFLDYIAGADIRYGGGQVTVLNPSPVVSPIKLSETRPTILNNTITQNADAAISADPNSFEETLFTTPRYQSAQLFAPDYVRVGPDIRGNTITNNSVNGLFVRTVTSPGAPLTTLTYSAKFDDTDIVHVVAEHLIIDSLPGGNVLDTARPDMSLVQINTTSGGTLAGASVQYKLTSIDRFGQHGLASLETTATTVGAGGAVLLSGLPSALGDLVGRSLWRSVDNGVSWQLVGELDRSSGTFVDTGKTLAGTLFNPNATEKTRGRSSGRLEVAPGIIVKLSGARIETSIGAQFIAEGTPDLPIIFTSRSDDRYGAGTTFDTFNDGATRNPSSGDWGGLVARHLSEFSLDHALVTYAGGVVSLPGGFAGFNAVEIHQSTARIGNTRFEMNASGQGGDLAANRDGRGPNAPSVVYVMGSQPVVVNNIFRDNAISSTAAIAINANALNSVNTIDLGRQTGFTARSPGATSNVGPLVRGNAISNTGINGMVVLGQVLTTESIWDDSDIVHVLMNELKVPDFHTYGGLTLRSRVDESLVVKLLGAGAGFTAMGRPLDIEDRIGGSVRILGTPGFPVVLTSLLDDGVGAGFDPDGLPTLDTNNDGTSSGSPGDWRSILFDPYANDRNVGMVTELETDQLQDRGSNDDVAKAQSLGGLAGNLNGGDENLRLGFSIDGAIAASYDQDIYSFTATAGTMVWLDIDRSSGSLDSVIELIDEDGTILAQSTNSLYEALGWTTRYVLDDATKILPNQVLGLDAEFHADRNRAAAVPAIQGNVASDFQSLNPHDAGMRIVLPGTPGEESVYYVRVRSSNVATGSNPATTSDLQDLSKLEDGLTTGTYRLQVRLRQTTEVPGSVVQYADIRYATNGIEAMGMPNSSPLLGQLRESNAGQTNLGNILNSDRGSVTVAGNLSDADEFDVYPFTISRDSIQAIPGVNDEPPSVSVIIDIDYAAGFGGPDTTIGIVDENGTLVYVGRASNIADDQPAILRGNDVTDLTRGSAGVGDPYIGPISLPAGNYAVIVSSSAFDFSDLDQFTVADATNPAVRVTPIDSIEGIAAPDTQVVEWNLSDVTTYVVRNYGLYSEINFINALTGALVGDISRVPRVHDVALAPDGRLVAFAVHIQNTAPLTDESGGDFLWLNSTGLQNSEAIPTLTVGNANPVGQTSHVVAGNHGIETYTTQQTDQNDPPNFAVEPRARSIGAAPEGDSVIINALTFYDSDFDPDLPFEPDPADLKMFGVGSRGNEQVSFNLPLLDADRNVIGISDLVSYNTTNVLYRLDPATGEAINHADRDYGNQGGDRDFGNFPDPNPFSPIPYPAEFMGAGTQKVEFGRFLSGSVADATGPYTSGRVTGLVQGDANLLFAVSNLGEFYSVDLGLNGETGANPDVSQVVGNAYYFGWLPTNVITDPETGNPIDFTGLSLAPSEISLRLREQGVIDGVLLIGTTANGTMYAINTEGELQPVFPGFSYKTRSIEQFLAPEDAVDDIGGLFSSGEQFESMGDQVHGITFASLDQNLWTSTQETFSFGPYDYQGGAHGALLTTPIDLSEYSPHDQPMLYFDYDLETEDQEGRDAFRVYGAGEDGDWKLLATNHTIETVDVVNVDSFNQPVQTQEAFDNTSTTRQARVPLAALAGKSNVRIRFEFSTGGTFYTGNPLIGGIELTAVAGHKIDDGTGFSMVRAELQGTFVDQANDSANDPHRFEFDFGLRLALPGGASLPAGFSVTLGSTVLSFAVGVDYELTDSPATLAAMVRNAVEGLPGITVSTNPVRSNEIAIAGMTSYSTSGLPAGAIVGTPGVGTQYTGLLPVVLVPVTLEMSAQQVGEAVRKAFAETYSQPDMLANFGLDVATQAWPHHENILYLHKFILGTGVNANDSAIGITNDRIGDRFGLQATDFRHRDEAGFANADNDGVPYSGITISNVVLGLAERGETVIDATVGGGTQFGIGDEESQNQTGRYQLTVRAAASYLVGTDIRLFNSNDRLARVFGIEVDVQAAGGIADATTFTLTDGKESLTFEFDVAAGQADPAFGVSQGNVRISIGVESSAEEIAEAIVAAINSPTVQAKLDISAAVRAQSANSSINRNSRIIELHGPAGSDLAGAFEFESATFLTPIVWGQDTRFGEDVGDSERERPQGQLLLVGNSIADSAQFGIVASAGDRSQPFGEVGDRPYPGAPINFPSVNTQRLAPGVVVMNNVLANNTDGGLHIVGDQEIDATVQIARVVNNTFYGGTDGILIDGGASPIILNNIFANTGTGVRAVDFSTAVLGANIYQSNSTNISGVQAGTFDITLLPSETLFVSTTNRRFYLAAGARAIDASLESLQERSALTQVKNPLGLPLSPTLAPDRDISGLLRVDDPAVNTPDGLGGNVFKDRGAVERADFVSPEAILMQPQDNDSAQTDRDRSVTYVNPLQAELRYFQILLQDLNGTGPDPTTVMESTVTLTENGRLLREGFDYVLGYDANSRILRFTPLAGIWRQDSVYEMTLNNSNSHRVVATDGSGITDGSTLTIVRNGTTLLLEMDSDGAVSPGAIPVPFDTGSSAYELATRIVYAVNSAGVTGMSARIEGDGNIMVYGATQATSSQLTTSNVPGIRDLAGNRLAPNRANGLTQYTIVMPGASLDFGDSSGANVPTLASENTNGGGRNVILPVDYPLLALGTWSDPDSNGAHTVASSGDDFNTTFSFGTLGSVGQVTQGSAGPARIALSAASGLDGQTFVISDGNNVSLSPITFEFDTDGVAQPDVNKVIVALDSTDTGSQVATKLTAAIWSEILAGRLTGLVPATLGNQIILGGNAWHSFDVSGSPGVTRMAAGDVAIVIPSDLSNLADGQWMSITDSLGRTVAFELDNDSNVTAGRVAVSVDLGTATPESIATALATAIQSQIDLRRLWLGGASATGSTVSVLGDDEDGITFGGLFNRSSAPVPVYVQSTGYGMLDAWIDWNGDGDVNDAQERLVLLQSPTSTTTVATSVPVKPGLNVFYVRTPDNAQVGVVTSRFRLSATGGLQPSGVGIGGEVEDHAIEIVGGTPPAVQSLQYSVYEDQVLDVLDPAQGVLSAASDADLVPPTQVVPGVNVHVNNENPRSMTIVPLVDVAHGTLELFADGTFTYTPNPDFAGVDTFVFRANDGRLVSTQPTTVTINVAPVNDAPEFDLGLTTVQSVEDSGVIAIADFMTGLQPGPDTAIDEQSQTLTITVQAFDPSRFTVQPTINSVGVLTYQTGPNVNSLNSDLRVRVIVTDNGQVPNNPLGAGDPPHDNSTEATFTISVQPVNDAPEFVLSNSLVQLAEDQGPFSLPWFATSILPGPISASDEMTQSVHFNVVSVDNPTLFLANAQPTLATNGTLTFTSAPNKNGSAVVVVQLEDDGLDGPLPNVNLSIERTFTITINSVNDAPEFAIPSTTTVNENQGLVQQQGFATGIRPGPASADDEVNQLVEFEVEALDPSLFTVQPAISPNGLLTFRVADYVNSQNVLLDGGSLQVRVRLSDDGPSNPPNQNVSAWKTFTINVVPSNDPPFADDYGTQTNEDTSITILASDILATATGGPTSDEQTQRVWISQVETSSARGGNVSVTTNGAGEVISILYTPPRDGVGTDSFVFVMRDDGNPSRQGTASVIVNIAPINDAPQFDGGANQTVTEDAGPITVDGWATNILPGPASALDEIDGQTVSFVVTTDNPELFAAGGQPAISSTGRLTFQAAADAAGTAVIRVRAVDNGSATAPNVNSSAEVLATITILPINDAPVFTSGGNVTATEDSGAVSQPWATNIAPAARLLANPPGALDEASQVVTFDVITDRPDMFAVQPTVSSTGVLSFTSAPNAHGSVVLVIRAVDSGPSTAPNINVSEPVTVTLTIAPTNDAPVAVNDAFTTTEDAALTRSAPGLLANDTDADLPGDTLSVVAGALQSTFGAAVTLNADGSFTYDPTAVEAIQRMSPGQTIIDTFVYTVRDSVGATSNAATVSITVTGTDDAPVAVDDSYNVGIGQTGALDILANDFDVDSLINPASVTITRLPIFGTVNVRSTGVVEYTPGPGFIGSDTFGYTVRDAAGNVSNEALVSVVVNTAPLAGNDAAFTYRNEPVTISVLANDFDADGSIDPSSVEIVSLPSSGSAQVQANGQVVFTPAQDFTGSVTFTYIVSDNMGLLSNPATVTVQVRDSRWQNPSLQLDVNADGRISAIDALIVINYLNTSQPRFLPDSGVVPPPYLDVNGDERVSALDALLVINQLNLRSSGGGAAEGEAEFAPRSGGVHFAMMITPQQMIDAVGESVVREVRKAVADQLLEDLGYTGELQPRSQLADLTTGSMIWSRDLALQEAASGEEITDDEANELVNLLMSCRSDEI